MLINVDNFIGWFIQLWKQLILRNELGWIVSVKVINVKVSEPRIFPIERQKHQSIRIDKREKKWIRIGKR